jgi:hypothetical protein
MLRFLFRLIGLIALAAAFVLLVIDGTRSIAQGALSLTRLGQTAAAFFPGQFPRLEPFVRQDVHPLAWDPVLVTLLQAPTSLCVGICGLLLMALARRPPPKIGYSNR